MTSSIRYWVLMTVVRSGLSRWSKTKLIPSCSWTRLGMFTLWCLWQIPLWSAESKATLGTKFFQYMEFINQLYAQQADWQYYDEAFRSYRQYNNVPFACFDPELKDEAINRARHFDQLKKSQMNMPSAPAKPLSTGNTISVSKLLQCSITSQAEWGKIEAGNVWHSRRILSSVHGLMAMLQGHMPV